MRSTTRHEESLTPNSKTFSDDEMYHRRRYMGKRNKVFHGLMDPSLLPYEVEIRKLSIFGCPEGELVGFPDFPLCR